MPIRSFPNHGVFFEPEVIGLMSEALEAACKLFPDVGQHETVREIVARRIIAAASIGERDPIRLQAAALAGLPSKKTKHPLSLRAARARHDPASSSR
jgi:hypothetical protein